MVLLFELTFRLELKICALLPLGSSIDDRYFVLQTEQDAMTEVTAQTSDSFPVLCHLRKQPRWTYWVSPVHAHGLIIGFCVASCVRTFVHT